MLKISRLDGSKGSGPAGDETLKLEGQVRGRWVDELRRACAEALVATGRLTLDLADVSFIDASGLALFHELAALGVAVSNCSLFAAELLKGVCHGRQ
jgi:ABC-type transporter Mla MlaB component